MCFVYFLSVYCGLDIVLGVKYIIMNKVGLGFGDKKSYNWENREFCGSMRGYFY